MADAALPDDDIERRVLAAVRQHALAGLLPAAGQTSALTASEYHQLCQQVGAGPAAATTPPEGTPPEPTPALLAPLFDLLWASRSGDGPWTRLMAGSIASAAFGARHLWQDLGAAGRPEVSTLMHRHFRPLAQRNLRHLKWKHHLFLCLGEVLSQPGLRPPHCGGCEEQPICFPGATPITVARRSTDEQPAPPASTRPAQAAPEPGTPGPGRRRLADAGR